MGLGRTAGRGGWVGELWTEMGLGSKGGRVVGIALGGSGTEEDWEKGGWDSSGRKWD